MPKPLLHPFVRALAALAVLAACDDGPSPAPPGGAPAPSGPAEEAGAEAVHERALVFLSADADSTLAVPWTFRTHVLPGSEVRERGVWLARDGRWERLAGETDSTQRTRAPGRILPGRSVRLIVGPEGALEVLVLSDPAPPLETRIGLPLAQWPGAGDESLRFHRAVLSLPSGDHDGYLLDLSMVRTEPSEPPGDWMFLHGGERLQAAFVERGGGGGDRSPARFRGWTRYAVREATWPELIVEWDEVGAFDAARRDVPARWSVSSPGGEVSGELDVVGRLLWAGEGDGPILPVGGFMEVEGEIRIEGETLPVRGIVHHRQR